MRGNDDTRRDPFESLAGDEPAEALGLTAPSALTRRGTVRKGAVRPSERRRRRRRLGVTFSDPGIPERLRGLALRWDMLAPDGESANVSALLEYLLLPRLTAAEAGEIGPPEVGQGNGPD